VTDLFKPSVEKMNPKVVVCLFASGLAAASLAVLVPTVGVVLGVPWNTFWETVGGYFALAVMAAFLLANGFFARKLLYRREGVPVEILGAFRYGTRLESMAAGTGCTWPYARLLASSDLLRLDTPWGPLEWKKPRAPRLAVKRSFLGASFEIVDSEVASSPLYFLVPLWRASSLIQQLRELGFSVS
jgi:hypothetical protein